MPLKNPKGDLALRFTKMNGAGNDFIILNNLKEHISWDRFPSIARTLCRRHLSIGADGLMVVESPLQGDLASIFDRMVPENATYYLHTMEGSDDMPAHAKSVLVGTSLTIPVTGGRLNLGMWQGIYLCEFRDYGGPRKIVVTVIGE